MLERIALLTSLTFHRIDFFRDLEMANSRMPRGLDGKKTWPKMTAPKEECPLTGS